MRVGSKSSKREGALRLQLFGYRGPISALAVFYLHENVRVCCGSGVLIFYRLWFFTVIFYYYINVCILLLVKINSRRISHDLLDLHWLIIAPFCVGLTIYCLLIILSTTLSILSQHISRS